MNFIENIKNAFKLKQKSTTTMFGDYGIRKQTSKRGTWQYVLATGESGDIHSDAEIALNIVEDENKNHYAIIDEKTFPFKCLSDLDLMTYAYNNPRYCEFFFDFEDDYLYDMAEDILKMLEVSMFDIESEIKYHKELAKINSAYHPEGEIKELEIMFNNYADLVIKIKKIVSQKGKVNLEEMQKA